MGYARPELLVEPDWVTEHANDEHVRIIDCATLEAYRRAHIPGAVQLPVHFYIKEDGPPGAEHGTFVMSPKAVEDLMVKLGVDRKSVV